MELSPSFWCFCGRPCFGFCPPLGFVPCRLGPVCRFLRVAFPSCCLPCCVAWCFCCRVPFGRRFCWLCRWGRCRCAGFVPCGPGFFCCLPCLRSRPPCLCPSLGGRGLCCFVRRPAPPVAFLPCGRLPCWFVPVVVVFPLFLWPWFWFLGVGRPCPWSWLPCGLFPSPGRPCPPWLGLCVPRRRLVGGPPLCGSALAVLVWSVPPLFPPGFVRGFLLIATIPDCSLSVTPPAHPGKSDKSN